MNVLLLLLGLRNGVLAIGIALGPALDHDTDISPQDSLSLPSESHVPAGINKVSQYEHHHYDDLPVYGAPEERKQQSEMVPAFNRVFCRLRQNNRGALAGASLKAKPAGSCRLETRC